MSGFESDYMNAEQLADWKPKEAPKFEFPVGSMMLPEVAPDGDMTDEGKAKVVEGMSILMQAVCYTAHAHGWWPKTGRNMGEMIALMHSELSEGLEAWRDGDNPNEIRYEYPSATPGNPDGKVLLYNKQFTYEDGRVELGKPVGVASEFADTIIRIMDTCETLNIPLVEALLDKAAYNLSRPYRHGGKLA